jgi:hypothetical protein
MAESPALSKPAVTRRQVVLIAVLGVILAAVLIVQFGGASAGKDEGGGRKEEYGVAASPSSFILRPSSFPPAPSPWPKLGGQVAAQYDPFAMPEPLAKQTLAERSEKSRDGKAAPRNPASDPVLAALRSKGTHALFRDGDGAAAVIDNRVVHVGDVLQGYRVVSIDDDGVLVTPSDSQDVREDRK